MKAPRGTRLIAREAVFSNTDLEMEAEFACKRSWRHIMGSTESGKEIVKGDFIGHVDDREARAETVAIAVKQVVVPDRQGQTGCVGQRAVDCGRRSRYLALVSLGISSCTESRGTDSHLERS